MNELYETIIPDILCCIYIFNNHFKNNSDGILLTYLQKLH